MLGAAAVAYLTARPKGVPGPSDKLLDREERARREFADASKFAANAAPGEKLAAERRLERAIDSLAKVEEELRAAQSDMEKYPVPEYLQSSYSQRKVMIAVTGSSGVGKSSFLNCVRGLRPKDTGSAKTGIIETTLEPTMYPFPNRGGLFRRVVQRAAVTGRSLGRALLGKSVPDGEGCEVGDWVLLSDTQAGMGNEAAEIVALKGRSSWDVRLGDGRVVTVDRSMLKGVSSACVFWDLPGVGTPNYPQATYVREMGIRYFDVVVLLTSTRFTEAELMLVKELRSWQVPFFLVRNKADVDVQAEIEAEEDEEGTALSKERQEEVERETLQTIKDYFKAELGLDRVYCISSRIRLADRFDFRMLERDLEESMSQEVLCK